MENLLTNKTASLTELRDPRNVIKKAGGMPVAIFNRNRLVGYFVPADAVSKISFELADPDEVDAAIAKRKDKIQPILDYLKDK